MYTRTIPKGHDNPLAEGKYHYRYNDPYDMDHIDCIDCHAPYGYQWTNKDKEQLAYLSGKNHYTCTFDRKFRYDNGFETVIKNVSKKFVCFSCRVIIKRPLNLSWNYSYSQVVYSGPWTDKKQVKKEIPFIWPRCSKCQSDMVCVNSKFKVPGKHDDKSWNYMEKRWRDTSRLTHEEYKKIKKFD